MSLRLRSRLPLLATLLAWCLLATTLAPFVAAAWRAQDAAAAGAISALGAVCTTGAAPDLQGAEPDGGGGGGHAVAGKHCPLCGHTHLGWLPEQRVGLPPYAGGETMPPLFLAAPRAAWAWAGAPPRGPPAQS